MVRVYLVAEQCDQSWAKFRNFLNYFAIFISIGRNFAPTLANFYTSSK